MFLRNRMPRSGGAVGNVRPWRWVVLSAVPLVMLAACGFSGPLPAPSPSVRSFSYEMSSPSGPITAGASLHLVWAPHVDPNFQTGVADVSLCFGVFGPWPDAATLKSAIDGRRDGATATCPLGGAVVTSDVVHTTSAAGEQFVVDTTGPREPGFYDFQQVIAAKTDHGGSTTVLHRFLEVRAR